MLTRNPLTLQSLLRLQSMVARVRAHYCIRSKQSKHPLVCQRTIRHNKTQCQRLLIWWMGMRDTTTRCKCWWFEQKRRVFATLSKVSFACNGVLQWTGLSPSIDWQIRALMLGPTITRAQGCPRGLLLIDSQNKAIESLAGNIADLDSNDGPYVLSGGFLLFLFFHRVCWLG